MRKILISLSIIGVVATIATGVTIALFNDTETSTGNIFTAGTLNLKVDHKFASYNGNPCTQNCVENTNTNLIQNGSFEVPEVTNGAKWEIFPSGTPGLVWTVEWEGGTTTYGGLPRPEPALTEYHENVLGPAQDGDQYAELDSDWYGPSSSQSGEPALTRIYQNINTVPGNQYKVRYYFSPRPSTGDSENILYVRIDNVQVQQQGPTAGGGSTNWTEYTYTFTATNALTKIEFAGGGTNNSLGVFLDNVKMHPIVCTYQIVGGTCTLWPLKDLGAGDYYWHYGPDMKPGDWGRNVISLHAYSNDAYACIITNNIIDNENDLIEPETNAGDITSGPGNGELSQFINVFAWEDTTQNNVYDVGEPIISALNTPLNVAIGRISLTASITKYIGIDWCAGTQSIVGGVVKCDGSGNQNVAQTDSFTASITAYAEQQRNNENFVCGRAGQEPQSPEPVDLSSVLTNTFAILSKSGITNTGSHTSVITGNIGSSPITAAAMDNVFCSEITGTIYGVDAAYTGSGNVTCFAGGGANKTLVDNAILAMEAAYTDAAGRAPDATELYGGNLGGRTFTPGVYKWSTGVTIPTDVTLSGGVNDVWIFQISGTLDIASGGGIEVKLTGGAKASNVFWQVAGATTLGTYSTFNGTILAQTNIAIQTGAVLNGRALAQTAVTLDANTVSIPTP